MRRNVPLDLMMEDLWQKHGAFPDRVPVVERYHRNRITYPSDFTTEPYGETLRVS